MLSLVVLHVWTSVAELLRSFFVAQETATRDGFLQNRGPRAKLLGVGALLVGAVVSRHPLAVAGFGLLPLALAVASSVSLRRLLARSAVVPSFSVVIVAPQAVLLPGPALIDVAGVAVTVPGMVYVLTFLVRVWTGVALLALLVLTTPFRDVIAGLRRLGVPATAVWLVVLTYRYLFLFFSELRRLLWAREARSAGDRRLRAAWRELGGLSGTFFVRTLDRGERVHRGMRARGGARPPSPYARSDLMGAVDALFVGAAVALAVGAGVGRWLP